MKTKFLQRVLWLMIPLLTLFTVNAWGYKMTYTFNTASWGTTGQGNWTSGTAGAGFTANQGVQITKTKASADATSPRSFTGITKIEVQYCTNNSSGVGAVKVKVGSGTEKSFSVTKPSSGGTTRKTATFNFSPAETGVVKVTGTCTTNSVYIYSVAITYSTEVTGDEYVLLTDASDLGIGDQIIIVDASDTYAMSKTQNTNNRGDTKQDWCFTSPTTIMVTGSTYVQTLTLGQTNSHWTFYTGSGYLYANGSSTNNYLKTRANNNDAQSEWTISVGSSPYNATITAQGDNTNKLLRYNPNSGSGLFSCYGSATQNAVRVFYHASVGPLVDVGTPSSTSFSYVYGNGPTNGSQNFTISGSNLTGNVVINAPTDYQIKNGTGSWVSSVTLTPSAGTISSTTIYMRLKAGLNAGSYNENITFTNNDDLSIPNISLTGTVSKANLNPSFGSDTYTITRDVSTSTTFTLTNVPNDYTGAITYTRSSTPSPYGGITVDGINMVFTATSSGSWTITAQFAADANYNAKNSGVTCTVNAVTRDTYIDNVNNQSVTEEQRTDNGVDPYVSPSLADVAAGSACNGTKVHLIGWASQAFVTNVGNGTLTGADSDYTVGNGFYAVGTTLPAASGTTYYAVWGEEKE